MTCFRRMAFLLLLLWSGESVAAQNATIQGGDVALHGQPDPNSDVLDHLNNGDSVQISNLPTQGYYKARTQSGEVGWIATEKVVLGVPDSTQPEADLPPPPSEPSLDQPLPPPPVTPSPLSSPSPSLPPPLANASEPAAQPEKIAAPLVYEDAPSSASAREKTRALFEVKAFGGYQKVSFSEVNAIFGGTVFSGLPYYGVQFGFSPVERFYFLVRVEHLWATANLNGWNFSLVSTPLMGGLEYSLVDRPSFKLQVAALVGSALSTTLDATATALPQPNLTELESSGFTEMVKLDFDLPITSAVALYAEGGYRFLNTESVGPSPLGSGGQIFQTSGVNTAVPLNLSGPFAGGGLVFLF